MLCKQGIELISETLIKDRTNLLFVGLPGSFFISVLIVAFFWIDRMRHSMCCVVAGRLPLPSIRINGDCASGPTQYHIINMSTGHYGSLVQSPRRMWQCGRVILVVVTAAVDLSLQWLILDWRQHSDQTCKVRLPHPTGGSSLRPNCLLSRFSRHNSTRTEDSLTN